MLTWLNSIGLSVSSEYGFLVYACAGALAVIVVGAVVSCIFGVFTATFHRR